MYWNDPIIRGSHKGAEKCYIGEGKADAPVPISEELEPIWTLFEKDASASESVNTFKSFVSKVV
jgi:hypothetical protein